jgi:hypothetical protein
MRSRHEPSEMTRPSAGRRIEAASAFARTVAMRASCFSAATSIGSWPRTGTRVNRSSTTACSTSISPSAGSTAEM